MIKRIKITDFKSIRNLELDLDPVTVLVGRSGTGKSNLVQAIRFLRNLLLNSQAAVLLEGGWQRIVPVGEKAPRTSIEITFSLPGQEGTCAYGIAYGLLPGQRTSGNLILMAEHLVLGGETVFSRSRSTHNALEWAKSPQTAGIPEWSDSPMLGSFPSLQSVVFSYAALSTGIGFYHFPAATLSSAQPGVASSAHQLGLRGLHDDATNYLSVLRDITQDFSRPELHKSLAATLQALNPTVETIQLDSLTNPTRAVVGHRTNDRIFELALEQESDGLRRFYAHLLALYQRPPKLTLVFEEPENAIFPGALSLLAEEFQAASREGRGQVILTTHSPILLDAFDVESVRAVEMRDGQTVTGVIAKEPQEAVREQLLTTGELLTVEQPKVQMPQMAQASS